MKPIETIYRLLFTALVIFAISACGGSSRKSLSKSNATGDATKDATSAIIPSGIKVTTIAGGGDSTDATESDLLKLSFGYLGSLVVKGPGELLFSKDRALDGSVKSFNLTEGAITDLAFTGLQAGITNPPEKSLQIIAFINDTYYISSTKAEYKLYSAPVATKQATWIVGGASSGNTDGAGQNARFTNIDRTAHTGDLLYFIQVSSSTGYQSIRSVELNAPYNVKKIAGGNNGYADAPAASASFNNLRDIVLIDNDKKLLVIDTTNNLVRQIDLLSTNQAGAKTYDVSTFAGLRDSVTNAPIAGAQDATSATKASFSSPLSIAKAQSGNLYIADNGNRLIRKIEFKDGVYGAVSTIAGSGVEEVKDSSADSAGRYDARAADIQAAKNLVFDGNTLYFIDGSPTGNMIRKIEFLDGAP